MSRSSANPGIGPLLILIAAAVLAAGPLVWLLETWRDPAYASQGYLMALAVCVLFACSVCTERRGGPARARPLALWLLALSGAFRLSSELLGINVLGALTLAVDVYAIALLTGTHQRRRAASPFWLAVLFTFALPVERIAQRVIGFDLQRISAEGACALLNLDEARASCDGIGILLNGTNVLVDLPCAGTRALTLLLALFALLAALRRPTPAGAVCGLAIVFASAWLANVARICVLALGVAYPERMGSVDVMAAPWHELIGLLTLTLGAAPTLVWFRLATSLRLRSPTTQPAGLRGAEARIGTAFLALALAIVLAPTRPLDVSLASSAPTLPVVVNGHVREVLELSKQEAGYFAVYGGGAVRARYGDHVLLAVSTTSPLRHLHAPDECLAGAGHEVRYLGKTAGPFSSALYKSVDPQGHEWRIEVSFVSSKGHMTTNVAHAVWLWLRDRELQWTMLQRVAPWSSPLEAGARFDRVLARAFDIPNSHEPVEQT